jgi:formylglycine-generating enzyme required for sulfatase activity/tetratricopeptide (TPR) repeat protein
MIPLLGTRFAVLRRAGSWLAHASAWFSLPALSALVMWLFGWVSSLAGPGYLSCLVAGLVLPTLVAIGVARRTVRTSESPERSLLAGLGLGIASATAAFVALLIQGVRVGLCDPLQDSLLYLLGPAFGTLLGGAWGVAVGLIAVLPARRRSLLAALLGLAGPFCGILISLVRFYTSPMVFAFDPFFGFFAGTPYDTGFDPIGRLLTYRLGSVATLVGTWLLARHLTRSETGRFALRSERDWPLSVACVLFFSFSFGITVTGKTLGHYSTTQSIRESLGHFVREGRCEVVFSGGIARPAAVLLARDCNAWLGTLEKRLGVPEVPSVTAFVFASVGEKEAAMGAGHTQVAKPWRREVYLNGAEFPHPVLGHELAHVVAGQTGRGPFRIAGSLGGWLPNAGLIEGMAMALAPDEDGDLSSDQWASALAELRRLPPISSLMNLDFLVQPGRLAYLVAGSFVASIEKHQGNAALRRWYGGESLEQVTGRSLAQLESNWHLELAQASLPESAREAARALFARKSALVRHCPHAIDRAVGAAVDAINSQEPRRACALVDAARPLDPDDVRLRQIAADCRFRSGNAAGAREQWESIANDQHLPEPQRDQAREALADRALESGQIETARVLYREIQKRTLDVDKSRTLELKIAADTPESIATVEALLTGGRQGANWERGVAQIARWMAASPAQGLPRYLLGRNLFNRGQYPEAKLLLSEAATKKLELPLVRSETERLLLIVGCAEGDREQVKRQLPIVLGDSTMPLPRREGTAALARRCLGETSADALPSAGRVPAEPNEDGGSKQPTSESGNGLSANHGGTPSSISARAADSAVPADAVAPGAAACPSHMALIPGGEAWIGGHYNPEEAPRFKTRFAPFCLDLTEVTMTGWQACVQAGKCTAAGLGSSTCNGNHPDRGNHPVNCVNHTQAEAYCAFRGARLPTEFEWEYAARGGEQALKYPWGSESPDGRVCWKKPGTCPVKSYAPGAFGLYDMSGNVWEWTSSDFGPYPFPPLPDEHALKIYRGGSWSRRFEKWMHLGLRNRFAPGKSGSHLGLRCALTPAGVSCPFERDASGQCLHGVLAAECPTGRLFNGYRCAIAGDADCPDGMHTVPGHGCQYDVKIQYKASKLDLKAIARRRSPEFDEDCRKNQPSRPKSYRLSGGEHLARNAYASHEQCKNRDVGVGWNSVCCP